MDKKTANAYKIALAGMVALAFAGDAEATERFPRWYIGLGVGLDMAQDTDVSGAGISGDVSIDPGYNISGSIGYMPPGRGRGAPGGMRIEAEIIHKENSVEEFDFAGVIVPATDDLSSTSYMLNILYDFNMNSPVMPYLGAGVGIADVEVPTTAGLGNTSDGETVFAWQILAGLGYMPVTLPNTIFSLGYRFHVIEETDYGTPTGDVSLDNIYSHSVEAGMKFRF